VPYEIELRSPARRSLNQLPPKVFDAVIAFMVGPLAENPHRVGKPLRHEFEGMYSARVGPYRILYEIHDIVRIVGVIRIAHRADVYRSMTALRSVV
jgi:mRNA interferase RelE/StbE